MESLPLQSDRLTLRAMTLADAEDLAERRSDPEAARFQSWTTPYPVERARQLIRDVARDAEPTAGSWFQFAVERRDDGRVVGDVAVLIADDAHSAEIGYTLHAWARGHGYVTEAVARVIDYLIVGRGLHRVEASTDPTNTASVRVLMRLGFVEEGVRRESYWKGEDVADDAIFGLLAREWDARP